MSELAARLFAAGLPVFPCRANKAPAVPKGDSWKIHSAYQPETVHWPSGVVGVPVPAGVMVIDLDTYKGITRADVDGYLGVCLPWDAALIQTTLQGGQHYAFACDWKCRFGSSLDGYKGLDTRTAGDGYIATGDGYTWNGFGLYALAHPEALPRIPDACRAVLEVVRHERPLQPTDAPTADIEAVQAALSFIDPGGTRTEWVKVGLALRHYFADDEHAGYVLFDAWSAGELWRDGCPSNYIAEHIEAQWGSFKAEGDTTVASLFYEAIQGGWLPPTTLNTSAAFGAGAAPADAFRDLVDDIQQGGGDPNRTLDLVTRVASLPAAPLQRAALLAVLTRELKDAGLLTKAVRAQLDTAAGAPAAPRVPGTYGPNHTENALQFLGAEYAGGALVVSDQVFYTYTGQAWVSVDDDDLRHRITMAMIDSRPQHSTITGTFAMMGSLAHTDKKIGVIPPNLILFQNGVLDLYTGSLAPHHPGYFTTNIMPYAFNPNAPCAGWLAFLYEVFEGDPERVALLQEWFGYMLSGGYAHHKVMLLLGAGRSGKSTIGRVLRQVVGSQNYSGGSFAAFTTDPYMESLRTKPVVFIGDAAASIPRQQVGQVIERIKTISGNDEVTFSRKYKSTLSEALPSRITIASNSIPRLFDDSGALASRLLVIPFEVSFYGRENLGLFDELMGDLEGIGLWALQGLARLNEQGRFTEPAASRAEVQHIGEMYSPMAEFLDDVCTFDANAISTSDEVYAAYRVWAVAGGEARIMAPRTLVSAFKDLLRGKGVKYGVHRRGDVRSRGFKGIALREQDSATVGAFTPRAVK